MSLSAIQSIESIKSRGTHNHVEKAVGPQGFQISFHTCLDELYLPFKGGLTDDWPKFTLSRAADRELPGSTNPANNSK